MIDRTKLPFGGETILVSRMRKLKPERVLVSLLPPSTRFNAEPYALVRAIPGKKYDWRFLIDVDTTVVCNQAQQSLELFDELAQLCKPLSVWFVDEGCGYDIMRLPSADTLDLGPSNWVWQLEFSKWYKTQNKEWGAWMDESLGMQYVQHIA